MMRSLSVDGATLALFDWQPCEPPRTETLLFAHATGFHARCWDQVIAELPEYRAVAVDQRGHGRSTGRPPVHWQRFGRDLAEVLRQLDLSEVVGIGHSMGGHAMTEAAAREPQRFRRLVLIDPVIAPPQFYEAAASQGRPAGQHPVARRRAHWASADEMFERMRGRPPFDTWEERVLRDYCIHGLLPDAKGHGYVLACRPEMESEVYMTSAGNHRIHEHARALDMPVLVVRAKGPEPGESLSDFRLSPTWPRLAEVFRHGQDLYLPQHTHFLPMEDPSAAARIVQQACDPHI